MKPDETTLRVRRLPHASDLPLPAYAREGDAGMDLCAAFGGVGLVRYHSKQSTQEFTPHRGDVAIYPGAMIEVPTGIAVEIPPGFEGQVRGRSGLLFKHGVSVPQTGTIDAGYRGEIVVMLRNDGPEPFVIRRGDRIAQLVVSPVARCRVVEADDLSETERGTAGFGSTGVR